MTDYKSMYHIMFNAATDALEAMGHGDLETAEAVLRNAQTKSEDVFIVSDEPPFQ